MIREIEYLIVGAGIAGVSAAESIRNKNRFSKIAVIEKDKYPLYSKVILKDYILGKITREKLFLRSLNDFEKNNIDLYLGKEIKKIDCAKKEAETSDGDIFHFEKLLVASGGRPRSYEFEKYYPEFIFKLNDLNDAERIKSVLEKEDDGKHYLVVGGGFIALEFLEILIARNKKTTLILKEEEFWPDWLEEKGQKIFYRVWEKSGIQILKNDVISQIIKQESGCLVFTKNGHKFKTDFIGVGIGLQRNTEFLEKELDRDVSSGISANAYLETSVPDVYAAGDVVHYQDEIFGVKKAAGSFQTASVQGYIAGLNMLAEKKPFHFLDIYAARHFDLKINFIGEHSIAEGITGVVRFDDVLKTYIRFFLKGDFLVGAILINEPQNISLLMRLILNKISLAKFLKKISNPEFPLADIKEE